MRLALLILAVRNLERSVKFYREAFGWTQVVDTRVYVEFDVSNNQRLGLYQREGFGLNVGRVPFEIPQDELAGTEIYFYVEDINESILSLSRAGAKELSALNLRDWGDEAAYFADLDGNVIVVAHRPV